MTQQDFINEIAKYVQKYAPKYGIIVYSPIIAQACLESAYGTSSKAQYNNFFGLKYRDNRITCHSGYFRDGGSEQLANGTYKPISDDWYAFENMEKGVEGYFQFINISRYANVKNVANPQTYLENLKTDGYATSINYVQNVMNVISKWDLTKFDKITNTVKTGYSNSPLVNYTKLSPNKTSPRNHSIDTITIHCMAGNLTVESCGNVFAPATRKASSNYGIDSNGRIGLYVEEQDRSWCSSNAANDNRAVTIEVANDGGAPDWHVSDKAMDALIKLCADICRRNNIKKLLWKGDKNLIGQVDKQNMTVHRWFAAKACPGNYLYDKHGYIAEQVNKILGVSTITPIPAPTPVQPQITPPETNNKQYYRVQVGAYAQKSNADAMLAKIKNAGFSGIIKQYNNLYKVQVGAYSNKANAEIMMKNLKAKGFNAIIIFG